MNAIKEAANNLAMTAEIYRGMLSRTTKENDYLCQYMQLMIDESDRIKKDLQDLVVMAGGY